MTGSSNDSSKDRLRRYLMRPRPWRYTEGRGYFHIKPSFDKDFFFQCEPFLKSSLNLLQYCFCFTFWFFGMRDPRSLTSN